MAARFSLGLFVSLERTNKEMDLNLEAMHLRKVTKPSEQCISWYSISSGTLCLKAIRKFRNKQRKILKLPLTMPNPRDDLLQQAPYPGVRNVVKRPKNARGRVGLGTDRAIKITFIYD